MNGRSSNVRQLERWKINLPRAGKTIGLARWGRIVLVILLGTILPGLLTVAARVSSADLPAIKPAPNTHNAPITSSIQISFNAAIDPTTVSTRTIAIHGSQHGLMTGAYAISNTQVLITPARPFSPGELVRGTVTTDTKAITGTVLLAPVVWQFRTAAGVGTAAFFNRQSGMDSTWSLDVTLGDLDGDGDLDIFLGHRDAASTIWFNDGLGNFTTNDIDLGTDFLIDVSLGDLDGDGDLDAILAGIQDNSFWRNDGHGTFSYDSEVFTGSVIIRKVALGDLDGDGDLDAVTVTACDPSDENQDCLYAVHRIWLNDGIGGFEPSTQSLGHGTSADVALGDLEGDGDLDALVVRSLPQGSAVWMNLGSGVFTRTQMLDGLNAASADFGDLDGDCDLDAFVAPEVDSTSAVWLNDGNGALAPGQHLENLGPVELGDLDGDGDLDAYSVNDGPDKVWLNQGDASFISSGQYLGIETSTNVELGDLDGDGDLDAITSGYNTEPSLWINHHLSWIWMPLMSK